MISQHRLSQLRRAWPQLLVLLAALTVYLLALLLSRLAGVPASLVIRDLAQTFHTPLGMGLIPSLGHLCWAAAAAICLFSASALPLPSRQQQLFLWGGLLSLLLGWDDLFLLHNRYVSELLLYGLYAASALVLLLRYRRQIAALEPVGFLLAVGLLGVSVLIDLRPGWIPLPDGRLQLLEDGLQFFGITSWLTFWWQAVARAIRLQRP